MGLNIKNEHVHALAREAARRTGQSQTGAIEAALERYLSELGEVDPERAAARIDTVLASAQARIAAVGPLTTEALDDDAGLPR
ncbi:type II toxin-antitoxin system VapB family antitoxin [Luteipulveratus halotolerans]|uniref:Antitoxin n=1 Tax=Luteipulveratus halotolerans TaxID=1631356 RepID=A0A0L6CLM2_9MICO|nr:type II toxin-antitoxin system VapB family antitoxin [Luteipulveratus halotolerans]KNX38629.1 hypothetical protein VV01_18170 [Luteipulveratus halotolerans]